MSLRTLIMALSFAVLAARPVVAQDLKPQLDDMVDHFMAVVFGQEYEGIGQAAGVLAKWQDDEVGITIQGRPTQQLADMAGKRFGAVTALTGVKFQQVDTDFGTPSIDLLFLPGDAIGQLKLPNTPPDVIERLAGDPTMVCFFIHWRRPEDRFVKGVIVANVDRDPVRLDSCLLEEITQVMGLPNDVEAYWKTLFNPDDVSFDYSAWDALYLRTLYDPRLEPGMSPEEVRATVRPIFAEALSKARKKP